jgi:tetratricopeptide (TPR) repeat protein
MAEKSVDSEGNVTPDSLGNYVYKEILNLPPDKRPKQKPIRKTEASGEVILAHYASKAKEKIGNLTSILSTAMDYLQDKKYENAIMTFNKIILLDPKNYFAYKYKADALVKSKRDSESIEFYNKALEIKSDYPQALRDKGFALYDLSKYDDAIKSYDKSLEIDPQDAFSWNYKGLAFIQLRNYDAAIACFDKAIIINPAYDDASKNKELALGYRRREQHWVTEASSVTSEDKQLSTLSDLDWEDWLWLIKKGKCLPIVGTGACYPFLPLKTEIADEWATKYNYPFENNLNLERVAQFLGTVHYDLYPKELLSSMLERIYPPDFALEEFSNTTYAVLADLNLPIYLTTNYDKFMESALMSRGKVPHSEYCKWNSMLGKEKIFSEYGPTESEPLVYHILGRTDEPNSMVLTERDYTEFVTNLTKDERMLSMYVRKALATNTLLFIGYSLEDIAFRTIFQSFSSGISYNVYNNVMTLVPPPGAKDENRTSSQRHYLEAYAKNLHKLTIYWGSASSFCYELKDRWKKFQD